MGKQLQYLCNCDEDQFDDYFKMMDGLLKSQRSDDAILFYYRLANMEEFNNFIFAVIFFQVIMTILQKTGIVPTIEDPAILIPLEVCFTALFMTEAYVRIKGLGWKGFWVDYWNRLDFLLVWISIFNILCDLAYANQKLLQGALGARGLKVLKLSGRVFRFIRVVLRCIKFAGRSEAYLKEFQRVRSDSPNPNPNPNPN